MKTTLKTESKLYGALLKWVEVADSTPSDPEQGVVLTYRADNGTLSFWQDFYEDDFEDLSFEDLVEAEEAIGLANLKEVGHFLYFVDSWITISLKPTR